MLKIDVEGQELDVLRGAERLFSSGRVRAVYIDGCAAGRAVEEFLTRRGFSLFDGRTLEPTTGGVFSLLALDASRL